MTARTRPAPPLPDDSRYQQRLHRRHNQQRRQVVEAIESTVSVTYGTDATGHDDRLIKLKDKLEGCGRHPVLW